MSKSTTTEEPTMSTTAELVLQATHDLAAFRRVMQHHGINAIELDQHDDYGELAEMVDEDCAREGLVRLGNFDAAADDEPVIITDRGRLLWAITTGGHNYVIDEAGQVETWTNDGDC